MHPHTCSPDPLLTKVEVAELLATTEQHVERLAASGQLPSVKVGRFVRFDGIDVQAFIASSKVGDVK